MRHIWNVSLPSFHSVLFQPFPSVHRDSDSFRSALILALHWFGRMRLGFLLELFFSSSLCFLFCPVHNNKWFIFILCLFQTGDGSKDCLITKGSVIGSKERKVPVPTGVLISTVEQRSVNKEESDGTGRRHRTWLSFYLRCFFSMVWDLIQSWSHLWTDSAFSIRVDLTWNYSMMLYSHRQNDH